ncbi:unnamed protein product [Closterium sp. Yama58-4]|nr:unnamed protein product [Closterium sp. Yama58-4]
MHPSGPKGIDSRMQRVESVMRLMGARLDILCAQLREQADETSVLRREIRELRVDATRGEQTRIELIATERNAGVGGVEFSRDELNEAAMQRRQWGTSAEVALSDATRRGSAERQAEQEADGWAETRAEKEEAGEAGADEEGAWRWHGRRIMAVKEEAVQASAAEEDEEQQQGEAEWWGRSRRRKREEGSASDMAGADWGGADVANVVRGAGQWPVGGREGEGGAAGMAGNESHRGLREVVAEMRARVGRLEKRSDEGVKIWEALMAVWVAAAPQKLGMKLAGISLLSDTALATLRHLHCLRSISLESSSGFTAAGVQELFACPHVGWLSLACTAVTDAALEGIARLRRLTDLHLSHTSITDVGLAHLEGLLQLRVLTPTGCRGATAAGMAHVARLRTVERLELRGSAVGEEGLQHLTALTRLRHLSVPPGVSDCGMKHVRGMAQLEKLGLWDAEVTAAGVQCLWNLIHLQQVATNDERIQGWISTVLPHAFVGTELMYF